MSTFTWFLEPQKRAAEDSARDLREATSKWESGWRNGWSAARGHWDAKRQKCQ